MEVVIEGSEEEAIKLQQVEDRSVTVVPADRETKDVDSDSETEEVDEQGTLFYIIPKTIYNIFCSYSP